MDRRGVPGGDSQKKSEMARQENVHLAETWLMSHLGLGIDLDQRKKNRCNLVKEIPEPNCGPI